MHYGTYHDLLTEEFERRKQLNSAYSLRAYARDLEISAPRLSQVLRNKQGLSVMAAKQIAKKLKLSDETKEWFCTSVGALHDRNFKQRSEFEKKIKRYKKEAKVNSELSLEYFKVIADWYHFAILELTYLKDFQNNNAWIANILGIKSDEVAAAITRMKLLDLLREKDGRLIDTFKFLATPDDVPSISLKMFNTQLIKKAMEAIHEQDVLEREMSSNIFAVNKDRLPELKEKLKHFRREFQQDADHGGNKNAVYCLGLQFYELTKRNL